MLRVRCICILLLAYSVSSTLQIDSVPHEDLKHDFQKRFVLPKEIDGEDLTRKYFNDRLENFDKAENGGGIERNVVSGHNYESNIYSNGPSRMKLTYKKRTTIGNKQNTHDVKTNDAKSDIPGKKDDLISGDSNLIPLLLEYLKKHKDAEHNVNTDLTVKSDLTNQRTKHLDIKTENGNVDSSKIEQNRREWNEMELALNNGKENKPEEKQHENNVDDNIYLANTNLRKEKETHDSGSIVEQLTKTEHQGELSSINDFPSDYKPEEKEYRNEQHGNAVIRTIHFANSELHKEKGAHNSGSILEQVTKNQGKFSSVNDFPNVYNKPEENQHRNDAIRTIHFTNSKLHKEKGAHDSGSILEQVTKNEHQREFNSINDFPNVYKPEEKHRNDAIRTIHFANSELKERGAHNTGSILEQVTKNEHQGDFSSINDFPNVYNPEEKQYGNDFIRTIHFANSELHKDRGADNSGSISKQVTKTEHQGEFSSINDFPNVYIPEEKQHGNDVIRTIHFANSELHKEKGAHNTGSISEQITKTKHQGDFSSINDFPNDYKPEEKQHENDSIRTFHFANSELHKERGAHNTGTISEQVPKYEHQGDFSSINDFPNDYKPEEKQHENDAIRTFHFANSELHKDRGADNSGSISEQVTKTKHQGDFSSINDFSIDYKPEEKQYGNDVIPTIHFANSELHKDRGAHNTGSILEQVTKNANQGEFSTINGISYILQPKETQHENDVIGTIVFANNELHKEKGAQNSRPVTEQVTKIERQGESNSVNNIPNVYHLEVGERVTTNPWNLNQLDSDHKVKDVYKSAESTHLDTSEIEFLVNNLCKNSKTNLLQFWKQAAGFFKLNDENLSNKQKFDFFLSILKKVNDRDQQNVTDIVPSEPETEVYLSKEVQPIVGVKDFLRSNPDKTQVLETNFNHDVLFSRPSEKGVGGLGTEEILLSHKHKPDRPIKETQVFLNQTQHTTSEQNSSNIKPPLDSIIKSKKLNLDESPEDLLIKFDLDSALKKDFVNSVNNPKDTSSNESLKNNNKLSFETRPDSLPEYFESPRAVFEAEFVNKSTDLSKTENFHLKEIKETSLLHNLDKEEKPDVRNSDKDYFLFKINEDSKEDTEKIKKYITLLDTPLPTNVHYRPIMKDENTLLQEESPELSISKPEGRKNVNVGQVLNKDYLLDYLNAAVTKEDTISEKKTPSLIETNTKSNLRTVLGNDDSVPLSVLLGLKDSKESDHSKEINLKRILVLLQYLRSLPEDELAKIILYLKLNKKLDPKLLLKFYLALKNNADDNNPSKLEENHTDELKILLQLLESQKKETEAKMQLDMKDNVKLHPKLSLKYNLSLKNEEPNTYQVKDLVHEGQDDSTSKWDKNDSSENSHHPKLHFKWNLKLKNDSKNYLTNVLLEIIYRFKEYGISDKALSEIIMYLKRTLSENDGATECQGKELNEKLKAVKNVFEHLLNLKKEAEAVKEV